MFVPCVSLWEPWATLWVRGFKKFETRSWRPPFTEPTVVAVQAAQRWEADQRRLLHQEHFQRCLLPGWGGSLSYLQSGVGFHFGHVIGLVRVVRVHPVESVRHRISDQERAFGDYTNGRYAWEADMWHVLRQPARAKGLRRVYQWAAPEESVAANVIDMERQGALGRLDRYPPAEWREIGWNR